MNLGTSKGVRPTGKKGGEVGNRGGGENLPYLGVTKKWKDHPRELAQKRVLKKLTFWKTIPRKDYSEQLKSQDVT